MLGLRDKVNNGYCLAIDEGRARLKKAKLLIHFNGDKSKRTNDLPVKF